MDIDLYYFAFLAVMLTYFVQQIYFCKPFLGGLLFPVHALRITCL